MFRHEIMNLNFKKAIKILLAALLLFGLAGWYAVENVLPYRTVKPKRMNLEDEKNCLPKGILPQDYGLKSTPFSVAGFEGIQLTGFVLESLDTSVHHYSTTLIMLHGIGGFKENFLFPAEYLTKRGIKVVAFDLRAHGRSNGEFCTFGEKEKYDVQAVVSWLLSRDSTKRIGIFGNSLGGAIAIQSLELDKRLKFGIIESTFHDLEKVVEEFGQNYSGIRSASLTHRVLEKSAKIADFKPFVIKPYKSAEAVFQPVLVVHGDRDSKIPAEFGRINFEHFSSPKKDWAIIPGAKHNGLWKKAGEDYWKKFADFCRIKD